MAEPWRCPQCLTWVAPHVSEHRCDGGQGSAGATVTPIVPPTTGSGGGTATITWTGGTSYGEGGWEAMRRRFEREGATSLLLAVEYADFRQRAAQAG